MNYNTLLLVVVVSAAVSSIGVVGWSPGESCSGCVEAADTMLGCIEEHCGPDCLQTPRFDSVGSLPDCCDMPSDSECTSAAGVVENCLENCLPECVQEKVTDYLQCNTLTSTMRSVSGCNLDDCMTQIALDREWVGGDDDSDDSLANTDKFFKQLTDDIKSISGTSAESCDGAEDKAKSVCAIGGTCCAPCNPELSDVMDCVVNDLVRPFQLESDFDSRDDDCNLECSQLLNQRRELGEETNTTNTTTATTATATKNAVARAEAEKALKPCFTNMNLQIVLGNITNAGDALINCMVNESVKVLVTDDSDQEPAATTSPASTVVVHASIISVFVVVAATTFAATLV